MPDKNKIRVGAIVKVAEQVGRFVMWGRRAQVTEVLPHGGIEFVYLDDQKIGVAMEGLYQEVDPLEDAK